ncbi:MAG: AAA family ATPase [Archangium sp.]|nr:AAA family ATPase [Archangium sp.]
MLPHHRILSLEVTGGFLQGIKLVFSDGLNCVIGGRGTGKTTVLEALRFALDRMPDSVNDRDRHSRITKLLQSNLSSGSVKVEIETAAGTRYTVKRGFGEAPFITNDAGKPVDINIANDMHFGLDVYSQNQIEDIANSDYFQLQLLDKFIQKPLEELERQVRDSTKALETNGQKVLETKKVIDDHRDATRELPDVAEKIRGFAKADGDAVSEEMRRGHEGKSLRERELKFFETLRNTYQQSSAALGAAAVDVNRRFSDAVAQDLSASPNRDVVARTKEDAAVAIQKMQSHVNAAIGVLHAAETALEQSQVALGAQQALQEQQYRALLDKDEQERQKGVERTRLEQRFADLQAKDKVLTGAKGELAGFYAEREVLRAQLSDLRDQRYRLRVTVADRLNESLSPMIRIQVNQFGNRDEYKNALTQAMKGSGLRYASIVERAAERLPPAEFASIIQREDHASLVRELDIDADRATRLIIQLKDKPEIFAIETVELRDRPVFELKDGEDYKDSASLSTGQKCTTILPLLLVESERPLLIDQPEDNLDNAFIFETIVKSITGVSQKRQLIFVTHNPNIPVLGDAARVFALRSNGRASTLAREGTVDDVAQEIILILEGGRAAFEARRERYGRPIPETKAR